MRLAEVCCKVNYQSFFFFFAITAAAAIPAIANNTEVPDTVPKQPLPEESPLSLGFSVTYVRESSFDLNSPNEFLTV